MVEKLDVNGKTYEVIKLLGKGKGGYSYLATDGEQELVVKQIHHEPCSYYQFGNKIEAEIRDYKHLKEIGITLPELLDVDMEKERIVKEYIAGDTVYDMVIRDCLYISDKLTILHGQSDHLSRRFRSLISERDSRRSKSFL